MNEVTKILRTLGDSDSDSSASTSRLLSLVYDELRQLAQQKLRSERNANSLQATALVHEVFLRLVGGGSGHESIWQNRAHFFGAAAEAMRRILVDAARRRSAQKRGGGLVRSELDLIHIESPTTDEEALAVNEVLDRLARIDPQAAELVKLRFYAGMTMSEIAEILEVSTRTAQGIWAYARAWLRTEIGK